MEPDSVKNGKGEGQRQVSDAPAKVVGSQTMRAGMLDDWRGAKDVPEKSASEANPEPPSNETDGTQQRGLLDDWWRGEPDNANQASGDAASMAGESIGQKKSDPESHKETPTLRDGKPRD